MVWARALAMVRLARPLVIAAGLLAFLTGACMAHWRLGEIPWGSSIAGLVIMVSAIVMGHYANEYADFDTDSITRRTLFSGGSGVLPSGAVPRSWALYGALAFLGLSIALTALSYAMGLIEISTVALVAIGIPLGWFYSMPPLRLERTWLGELDNALLGAMMFLIGYVAAVGSFDIEVLALSAPIFLAVLINLLGVHYADMGADEMVGKRTMAVVLGPRTKHLFIALVVMMYVSMIPLALLLPSAVTIACLATLPVAIWAVLGFTKDGGPKYGSILMASLFAFAAIGFILA
ncbi:MAG: prenyltransferase [Methanomassiliicoccales archaeon]|nr:prenyltransferase [Methanomassiliicoccales archaeon]MDD1757084.1 prenyltransferase [Methanomassiliicoccales archaeon]